MEQLTLQDHPQVLVIDENTDNGWEGGCEKDEKTCIVAALCRSFKLSGPVQFCV